MEETNMLRRICAGTFVVLLLATGAWAQPGTPDFKVSGEVLSHYMWNGSDRVEASFGETAPVFQPKLELGVEGSPLRAHVLGSFTLANDQKLHEAVYGLSAERSLTPLVAVTLRYDYYDDQSSVDNSVSLDQHEVAVGLKLNTPTGVVPSAVVKYENPTADGIDSYFVAVGSLKQTLPVVPAVAGAVGVDVSWSTSLLYQGAVKADGNEVVPSGVSAWQVGLAADVVAGGVVIKPQVNYQVTVEDAVNDKNPFWAGVGVGYAF
jgi:hypothetical protein